MLTKRKRAKATRDDKPCMQVRIERDAEKLVRLGCSKSGRSVQSEVNWAIRAYYKR
jgi:uncharacterized protein (DUF4415 family)